MTTPSSFVFVTWMSTRSSVLVDRFEDIRHRLVGRPHRGEELHPGDVVVLRMSKLFHGRRAVQLHQLGDGYGGRGGKREAQTLAQLRTRAPVVPDKAGKGAVFK